MIPFTQYHLPNGRKTQVYHICSEELTVRAQSFIDWGGWFEAEILLGLEVSLTACAVVDSEPQDIAIEMCPNGPEIPLAVQRLVENAEKYMENSK